MIMKSNSEENIPFVDFERSFGAIGTISIKVEEKQNCRESLCL